MKREYISKQEMERITESVLYKANIPFTWQGKVTRIDIDSLIEFSYGLDIVWEKIDHFANDGIVLAAIYPKNKTVYLNETYKDLFINKMGTRNFSLAHELGHWILHVVKQQDYEQLSFVESDQYLCRGGEKRPPEEIQADMFAASLLMPKNILTEAINQMKSKGIIEIRDLYQLKDKFEVSLSALQIRINELGLLYIKDGIIFSNKAEATGQLSMF